jgi:acyl-CoA thioester hydrolase
VFYHQSFVRVRYAETDQMGFVYYGHYATYFEVARVEAMKALGISYRSLEEAGILMPVTAYSIQYKKPGRYDELLRIETRIDTLPSLRIRFQYTTFNENNELLNQAETELVFIDKVKNRPVKAPTSLLEALAPHFNASSN